MKYRFIQVAWGFSDEQRFICESKKHWWNDWKPILEADDKTKIYNNNDRETITRTVTY